MANLGQNYKDAGRLDEAIALLEETLKLGKGNLGPEHETTLRAMNNLAGAYLTKGRHDLDGYVQAGRSVEAIAVVNELLASLRQTFSADSPELAGGLADLSLALLQVTAFADAEPMLRECLTIREKTAPDDWRTFNTKSMLGGSLVGQAKQLQATDATTATAKFTEAEPLLVQGYEGMQQREDKIPPEGKIRLTEALQRFVDLYTASGKPDEAAKWQEKLDAIQNSTKLKEETKEQ
jgi:tetratricopeptide (TPR) repeat protein